MNIAWDITSKCNLSCIHCYNARNYSNETRNWNKNDLTTSEIKSIIHKLKDNLCGMIQFLGGEPFVRKDFIKILQCAESVGIECNIATNGIPLNDDKIAMLAEIGPRQIAFSIDGGTATTNDYVRGRGAFNKSKANLKKLSEYFHQCDVKTRLGIQYTINSINTTEINMIIDLAKKMKLHFVSFDTLKVLPSDQPIKDKLSNLILSYDKIFHCMEIIAGIIAQENDIDVSILNFGMPKTKAYFNKKYGINLEVSKNCPAVSGTMYIRADGNVFPCNHASNFPKESMSNIIKKINLNFNKLSFNEVVDSEYFRSFYYFAHSGEVFQRLNFCKNCSEYNICNPCPLDVFRSGEKVCRGCMEFKKYLTKRGGNHIIDSNILRKRHG